MVRLLYYTQYSKFFPPGTGPACTDGSPQRLKIREEADHGRRAAARAGRSAGDLRIPVTTSRRQTGSPGHVPPRKCTSDGVRCRVPAAPLQPGRSRHRQVASLIRCFPPTLPRKIVCTKYLGTVYTVVPTIYFPPGTAPACTGDGFFCSPWLAEITLKEVPLPNVTTPAPLQHRWQAVQLAVAACRVCVNTDPDPWSPKLPVGRGQVAPRKMPAPELPASLLQN